MTFRHIVVPIKLIKGDTNVSFIVFLNFEYGSKAACRNGHELINLCKQIQQSTTPLFFLKALKFPNIVFFHFDEKIGKLQL
jgi:hypothetical protein